MCTGVEVALLVAAAASAAGTVAQGKEARRQAGLQAEIADRQAARARQEAEVEAAAIRRQRSRDAAALRARLAASGIDVSTGSPLLALESQAADTELAALSAINRGDDIAAGHRVSAALSLQRGRDALGRARGEAARGLLKAV